MAAKRMSNVSPSVYSFSEDSVSSDEGIADRRQVLNNNLKRTRHQSSVRQRNSKVRRLQHISSSCDESVRTNRENCTEESNNNTHYKKQACNSKNAILARENRLKKKLYLDSLESKIASLKNENRKMKITLGTQSSYVTDLESELNYLRSILANSKEISMLLKTVQSSGLPVSTSLQNNFTMQSNEFTAKKLPIARKTAWSYDNTHHDMNINDRNIPTPPTSLASASPSYLDVESPLSPFNIDVTSYFSDDDTPIALNDVELSPFPSLDEVMSDHSILPNEEHKISYSTDAFLDHSYSSKVFTQPENTQSNYGVCLHISNKKVSIEFCSKCSANASANWEKTTP